MPTPFSSTLRSLEDRHGPACFVGLGLVVLLLGAWIAWFLRAPLTLHAVSTEARLEADRRPHDVANLVTGRILAVRVELGQEVAAGDLLVELDDQQVRRLREAQEAQAEAAEGSLRALEQQRVNEAERLEQLRRTTRSGNEEARSLEHQAEAEARQAEAEAERLERLFREGIVGEAEAERAASEAERLRAQARAMTLAVDRRRSEARADESAIAAQIDELAAAVANERGRLASARAEIARLDDTLEHHVVRAPVDGRVGRLADLRTGAVITAGTPLASIVPTGAFRVIADFEPSAAVGRIRPGQDATVRFDGFPWTQFGSLEATARRVASEPAAGRIRVELEPHPETAPAIPLQHGLPATVEVAVEEGTPAQLVLRIAGRGIAGNGSDGGPPSR